MPSLIFPFLLSVGILLSPPGSIAWTPTTSCKLTSNRLRSTAAAVEHERTTNRRRSRLLMSSLPNDDDADADADESSSSSSLDGFQLTTRTAKVLKFDDNASRFFETDIVASATDTFSTITSTTTAATATSTVVPNNFPPHELVPTEILFGRERQPQSEEGLRRQEPLSLDDVDMSSIADNNNYNDYDTMEGTMNDKQQQQQHVQKEKSIIEECYDAWNRRDFDGVINCFSNNSFTYQDSLYLGSFTISDKNELKQHFMSQSNLLPKNCHIVVDEIAVDPTSGNIGTQWHVENVDTKTIVPYTRGCSFYTTALEDNDTGHRVITSGFRTSEMIIKPSKEFANRLVSSASSTSSLSSFNDNNSQSTTSATAATSSLNNNNDDDGGDDSTLSIIEKYFNAWNERNIDKALNYFVDDCTYQTEDPVFVDTMYGKDALREHLLKNVDSLPSSCEIILDNIAVDAVHGTIGTCWHLQVKLPNNGMIIPIPNLRGCSMYTTDIETGLLKSGYDVTEAPIKLPKQITSFLNIPARLLFGS